MKAFHITYKNYTVNEMYKSITIQNTASPVQPVVFSNSDDSFDIYFDVAMKL